MRKSFWLKVFRKKLFCGKNICGKVPENVLVKKVFATLSGKKSLREKFLCGKVFGVNFPWESFFKVKIFAES